MTELVFMKTHLITPAVIAEFSKLQSSGKQSLLLIDNDKRIVPHSETPLVTLEIYDKKIPCFLYDKHFLEKLGLSSYTAHGKRSFADVMWSNGDYTLYLIRKYFPQYTHYWQIEYDVFYADKDYTSFFASHTDDCDLIIAKLQPVQHNDDWYWSNDVSWLYGPDELMSSFFPVLRISGRALDKLYKRRILTAIIYSSLSKSKHIYPHCELFVPTEVKKSHYSMRSLENLGIYTTAPTNLKDNPVLHTLDQKLYHPVKP